MKKIFKSILIFFDDSIFRLLVKWIYPKYNRQRKGYVYNFNILRRYFFMQKIMGFNRCVPWPVDFRSKILGPECIEKGINHMWTLSTLQLHPKVIIGCDEPSTNELKVKTVNYFKQLQNTTTMFGKSIYNSLNSFIGRIKKII